MEYDAKAVGKRIAELRSRHNMTQDLLAEKIGVTGKHLSRVEHGGYNLTPQGILKVCDIFLVSVDYLYTGNLDMPINKLAVKILDQGTELEKKLLFNILTSMGEHIEKS